MKQIIFILLTIFISSQALGFKWFAHWGAAGCAVKVGGYCWYLGEFAQSCDVVCSTHGGYNSATATFAGNSGSTSNAANCLDVLTALGRTGTFFGSYSCSSRPTAGCLQHLNTNLVRCVNAVTTSSASHPRYRRACACNN